MLWIDSLPLLLRLSLLVLLLLVVLPVLVQVTVVRCVLVLHLVLLPSWLSVLLGILMRRVAVVLLLRRIAMLILRLTVPPSSRVLPFIGALAVLIVVVGLPAVALVFIPLVVIVGSLTEAARSRIVLGIHV